MLYEGEVVWARYPFIRDRSFFYQVVGADGILGGGRSWKKFGFKGAGKGGKHSGFKEGVTKKNS